MNEQIKIKGEKYGKEIIYDKEIIDYILLIGE